MAVRRPRDYLPQQLSADAGLTGRENVAPFARVFAVPRRERAERVAQARAGSTSPAPTPAAWSVGANSPRPWSARPVGSSIARTGVREHRGAVRAATRMTGDARSTSAPPTASADPAREQSVALDFAVPCLAAVLGIGAASALLGGRLADHGRERDVRHAR